MKHECRVNINNSYKDFENYYYGKYYLQQNFWDNVCGHYA